MNKVVEKASVATRTVTEISEGKHDPAPRTRRKPTYTGRSGRVDHTVIDMRVWKKAMQIAKGNRQRLEVRTHDTVIVHNHTDWKSK